MSTFRILRWSELLDHSPDLGYAGGVARRTIPKRELAADAWRPLARFFFDTVRHRQRILVREGLTPNDARAFMALDRTEGKSMRALADEWACDASNATFIVDRLEERGAAQ